MKTYAQQIPAEILAIAQQLHQNERPRRALVKTILKWFRAKRRGSKVVVKIKHAIHSAGLATDPDLSQAGYDAYLTFCLIHKSHQTDLPLASEGDHKPVQQEPQRDHPEQPSDNCLEPEGDDEPQAADDARPVASRPADWTIPTLRETWNRGLLDLQPAFQREYVWRPKPELPSRLIESVLLEIPIPPLYLGRLPGGKLEVIDGQQRLTTLINFISDEFALRRLSRMPSLNSKKFRDLSIEHQQRIRTIPIRIVEIDAGNNTDLRYEIFERLKEMLK